MKNSFLLFFLMAVISSFSLCFATLIENEEVTFQTRQGRSYKIKKPLDAITLYFSENDQGKEAANPEQYKTVVRKMAKMYCEMKESIEEIFYQSSTTQYNISPENLNETFSLSKLVWKHHLFSQIYGNYLQDFDIASLMAFTSLDSRSISFDAFLPALLYCQSLYDYRLKGIFYAFIQEDINKGTFIVADMGLKMMSVRFSNVIDENLEIEKLKIHFLDAERIITNRKILFHQKLRKFLKEILSQDSSLIPLFYACQDFVLSDYQKTDSARKILEKEGLDRIVLHHLIAEAEESHEEGLIVFNHREKFMDILNSFLGDFPGIEDHFSVIKYMRDYIGILMIKADVLKKALDEISASDVNLQKSKHPKRRHQKFGKSSMVLPENDKRCEDPKLCKLAKELGKDPMVIVQQLDEDPNASTAYIDGDFRLLKRIINKDPMGAPKTKLSKKRTQPKKQPNGKANKKPKARPAREMSSGKIADKEKEHQTVSLQKGRDELSLSAQPARIYGGNCP